MYILLYKIGDMNNTLLACMLLVNLSQKVVGK